MELQCFCEPHHNMQINAELSQQKAVTYISVTSAH